MATILNSYLVTCLTESIRVVSDYRESPPTKCPNNTQHTIDPDQTTIYRTVGATQTTIVDQYDGYYQVSTELIQVPTGTPGDITSKDVSWPADITVWSLSVYFPQESAGDEFNIITAPDNNVGVLTDPVNVGANTITVSENVIQNVRRGLDLTLFDGINRNNLGRITAIDSINMILTFEQSTTNSFTADTNVLLNVYTVRNYQIRTTSICPIGITMGNRIFVGKNILANTIMRVVYKNLTGTQKEVVCKIEYAINN